MQASHQTSDMYWAGIRLGETRLRGSYAWRSLLASNVIIPNGSDAPVERVDPLISFKASVARQDAANWPIGGWYPEQRMTREEALLPMTLWPAYAAFQEQELGSLSPGKRRFTAMSPTIVFKGNDPYIVIGAPGGTFITMGILQGILNVIDFGMNMSEAVVAPRFTANSNTIDVSNRIPRFVTSELEQMGYPVARNYHSYPFAGVHGIRIRDGKLDGGADPGRDGMALGI